MHRNAGLIDGSGVERRVSDVAVSGAAIAEVGHGVGPEKREINAEGLVLTPSWVDIHTHYDAQATWDPYMSPSANHGVTTAIFSNCGVGFAPVRPGQEKYLINLMEEVEDIPETVLSEGMDFTWESFPEYLDTLDSIKRVMDIGAQMPHAALRFYVMGERGADHAGWCQSNAKRFLIDSPAKSFRQLVAATQPGQRTGSVCRYRG